MTLFQAKAAIRERMMKLDAIYRTYREYAQQRLDEEDLHGLWDAGANASENRCERAGWQGAMDLLDQVDVPGVIVPQAAEVNAYRVPDAE